MGFNSAFKGFKILNPNKYIVV